MEADVKYSDPLRHCIPFHGGTNVQLIRRGSPYSTSAVGLGLNVRDWPGKLYKLHMKKPTDQTELEAHGIIHSDPLCHLTPFQGGTNVQFIRSDSPYNTERVDRKVCFSPPPPLYLPLRPLVSLLPSGAEHASRAQNFPLFPSLPFFLPSPSSLPLFSPLPPPYLPLPLILSAPSTLVPSESGVNVRDWPGKEYMRYSWHSSSLLK